MIEAQENVPFPEGKQNIGIEQDNETVHKVLTWQSRRCGREHLRHQVADDAVLLR